MTSGRKPTPTALKLVKGNPGKRAVNKAEAVVALSEPTPPAKFSFWLHCATPILWGCSDFMREAPCMPRRRNKNDNEKTRTPGL